jgi:hypothetical protein
MEVEQDPTRVQKAQEGADMKVRSSVKRVTDRESRFTAVIGSSRLQLMTPAGLSMMAFAIFAADGVLSPTQWGGGGM